MPTKSELETELARVSAERADIEAQLDAATAARDQALSDLADRTTERNEARTALAQATSQLAQAQKDTAAALESAKVAESKAAEAIVQAEQARAAQVKSDAKVRELTAELGAASAQLTHKQDASIQPKSHGRRPRQSRIQWKKLHSKNRPAGWSVDAPPAGFLVESAPGRGRYASWYRGRYLPVMAISGYEMHVANGVKWHPLYDVAMIEMAKGGQGEAVLRLLAPPPGEGADRVAYDAAQKKYAAAKAKAAATAS